MFVVCFSGEPGFYSRVLSLCRALSQYLLTVSQLPSSLHIPSDKEHLITTFTCTATEVKCLTQDFGFFIYLFFNKYMFHCSPLGVSVGLGGSVASPPGPVAPERGPAVGSVLPVSGPAAVLCLEQALHP